MKNVLNIKNCYGCGVCAASCPKDIISIKLNNRGFYEPVIQDQRQCIDCSICLDVCAFNHHQIALNPNGFKPTSYAAWSNDSGIRKKCSSGGIGFEIGKQLIERGYHAVGCRYDIVEQRAEHYIATTVEDFVQSIGSKYIQSYTETAFKEVKLKGQKYLVTGTPCQIDSFRRMIRRFRCEENFVLLDFFCHCVPSMYVWKAYIKKLEPVIGQVTYASWRNKFDYGWHDSWSMRIDGINSPNPINWHESYNMIIRGRKNYIQSRRTKGDLFYKLFLGDLMLGPQCQHQCKYKYDKSSADIRIGDLWGGQYKNDELGVSALIAFTQKGQAIIDSLSNVTIIEHPFNIVAEGQMKKNAKAAPLHNIVRYSIQRKGTIDKPIEHLIDIALVLRRIQHWVINPMNTLSNFFNKLRSK